MREFAGLNDEKRQKAEGTAGLDADEKPTGGKHQTEQNGAERGKIGTKYFVF